MLWLCLRLPALPLEVFTRGGEDTRPLAVRTGSGAQQYLLACNGAAQAKGAAPGISVNAAYALAHDLRILPRDEAAEAAALERIAAWATQFTPTVSLEPPDSVLLEVAGSLDLFGGVDALCGHVRQGLAELGYRGQLALAPTPTAAWLFVRAGCEIRVTEPRELGRRLNQVPIRFLHTSAATLEALHGTGLRSVGDCLRLPRAGFARRFGPDLLRFLDRAAGQAPDPRQPYVPPPHFEARLTLPAEVESREALLFPVRRLLLELVGYLHARECGVQRLVLTLLHRNLDATRIPVGLVSPSRDPQHLLGLTRERLEQVQLPAAVQDIQLAARDIRPLAAQTQELFLDGAGSQEDWAHLVERLRARLGEAAVQGICLVPEHRPERAWRGCAPGTKSPRACFGPRPLWLLRNPVPLESVESRPHLEGALTLQQSPEIIESGWWDGQDVAREYFVAQGPHGARFWIFRERREPGGWFLHGIFA